MIRIRDRSILTAMAVAGAVATAGCSEHATGPEGPSWGRLVPQEVLSIQESSSGYVEPRLAIITNAQEWAEAWATIYAPLTPTPPLPGIDFATSVVVLAAMGARPSGGYSIAIEEVRAQDGMLHVRVLQRSPGASCVTTGALTAPVHVVQAPRAGTTATFSIRSETYGC
jgi:hypothetical protein